MKNAGASKYREQEILTASPARLVAMLFEGAITSLRKAIQAIEAKDIEARWKANRHAIEIVHHLLATLDHEQGGEIATDLERLYIFIIRHLVNVDLQNDPAPALEAIDLLEPLHRAWCELDQQLVAEGSTASTADGKEESGGADTVNYGPNKRSLDPASANPVSATA